MRAEVEALLDADATPHEALQTRVMDEAEQPDPLRGMQDRIPGYRVLAVLGRGGMGIVYRAQQERPNREVALKVLRPEFIRKDLLQRFVRETEVQGTLRHPGIAAVYDAGMFDSGFGMVPYFAMELVPGVPIDSFAEQHQLDLMARCRLLVDVCQAMQHAHEHGVVHRDLKPGNVLVEGDAHRAVPRVLDFGIARVRGSDISDSLTQTGQLFGTLPYMSPEQVSGAQQELDARSDVYALGVIMFELATGRLPVEVVDRPLTEVLHILAEVEAPRLRTLCPDAPRDLEVVIATAIEKDPRRRYPTARAFADDLVRVLEQRAILARRATAWDRAAKFVRRNRALTAWATAAFVALVTGLIGVSVFAARNAELAIKEAQGRLQLRETLYSAQIRDAGPWLLRPDSNQELRRLLAQWPQPEAGEPELRGFEYDVARTPLRAADLVIDLPAHVDRITWPERDRMLVFARGALYELSPFDTGNRRELMGPDVRVNACTDRAGRYAAYWKDGKIWWRDLQDQAVRGALDAPEGKAFVMSGDASWFAWSSPGDDRLLLHERATGRRVFGGDPAVHQQMQFSSDGESLLTWRGNPQALELRSASTGAIVWRHEPDGRALRFVALSPDANRVAAALDDESVGYWGRDHSGRVLLRQLRFAIQDMRWNHSGTALAVTTELGETIVMQDHLSRHFRVASARALAFSPDDQWLAVGTADGQVHLLDLGQAAIRRLPQQRFDGGPRLQWRGNHQLLIGRHDLGYRSYDLARGSYASSLEGDWNQDASMCATVVRDAAGKTVSELPYEGTMAWSPTEPALAIAAPGQLVVAQIMGPAQTSEISGPTHRIIWSHSGQRLARCSVSAGVELRDREGRLLRTLPGTQGTDVAWSPDDRRIAASTKASITIFDAETGDPLSELHGLTTNADSIDWHPSGSRIVAGAEHGLLMWDADRGHVVLAIDGWRGEARWSSDGLQLALLPFGPEELWVLRSTPR